MSKRYRQLLPIPDAEGKSPDSHPSGTFSTPRSSSDELLKRQRIGTQLACNACRKRKIRCDGRRPQCEACRRTGEQEPCTYSESRSQGQSKETEKILELFNIMKTGPENLAIDILQIIRSHSDLDTALSILQPRLVSAQHASGQRWPAGATKYLDLESELMARYSLSFPPLQPYESSILNSVESWAVLSTGRISNTDSKVFGLPTNSESNLFPVHHPRQRSALVPGPCDERLQELNISFWTTVPIPSDRAAKVILLYLQTDHPLLGTFDPDLFVKDLVNCETTYCSRFLLSALMYWGCQIYSAIDPTVKEYTLQFCQEAETRWSEEKSKDSFLTLAGTQLLGLAYMGDGKNHYVLTYMSEANSMGARLGLFGVDPTVTIPKTVEESPELQSVISYAAWGSFNWIVLVSLFYQQPGVSYPE
ncbi:hypothetical protein FOXG_19601 [Fusarium oxysporum f. sp. lycopersici 4287]|uniref:Zn(2)-C6 fungal-type domain-containing protein n=1 Tax=Fusarium oxysporum f. sp. lycopersici (strain 4287 / CBS 123668 / FGSC 9935 / NRRL 34936) TaxID=426428 RepID=A0A0J9V408_FUSO4|nr:hypothetical protein FOXG_19601 [Fusarium oxysporum f. sp. lycopersici 4287]KNB06214.1 hypothetical protein FOXG_19601 [Fusarium oxysporum f. sp. lycopersici 4287]